MSKTILKTTILFILTTILAFANFTVNEKLISLKIGNGEKQMYIAANPQCKYTRIFFDEAKETLKDYTVNILLLKREHLKDSYGMIDYILLGGNNEEKVKRFKDIIFNNSKEYAKLPSHIEFKKKVKEEKRLKTKLYEQENVKKGWDSFMTKRELYYLDTHYRFAKENKEFLDKTDKLLSHLDATNSPTIFNDEWKKLDWMNLVKSKDCFRKRCFAKH
jgi:hypothetical protein